MRSTSRHALPLVPLLHAYLADGVPTAAALHALPGLGPRFAAVLGATVRFFYADFLDRAGDDDFAAALERFYTAVVALPLHTATLRRRAGFVRHALAALLHGQDSLPRKLEACLDAGGTYHVPGLGPAFWSALAQALAPARHPGWAPPCLAGAQRLGLLGPAAGAGPAAVYAGLMQAHARIRGLRPQLNSLHVDHFLSLVAVMPGRNLAEGAAELARDPVEPALRRHRGRVPLRDLLKVRGQALADAQRLLEAGLGCRDGKQLGEALAAADPFAVRRCPLDWAGHAETLTLWLGRLWEADDPYPILADFWKADPLPGAGLWLPCAVLHLRDPQRFAPYGDPQRQAHALLDDGLLPADPPAERYRLFNEAVAFLRDKHTLHPLEVPGVLAALAGVESDDARRQASSLPGEAGTRETCRHDDAFRGFCADTFAFLAELGRENRRAWMDGQRHRYRFAVRAPLVELCRTLAARYVEPVLGGQHGWHLDTCPRSGRALTSICKNAFGRSLPYNTALWITFCPLGEARAGAQLFVRLSAAGCAWGLRLGQAARVARAALRAGVERQADALVRVLRDNGALASCRFGLADVPESLQPISDAEQLLAWARGRTQEVSCNRAAGDPLATSPELAGEILLAFDRLLPLFGLCMGADVPPGEAASAAEECFGDGDFCRHTYLGAGWLERARELLSLKKQLILQGVPGTGKTHVARCLARLLTGGREDALRLVQFHPAYSYEEFVEGIRVKSVAVDGRHDVSYPVEAGLLCEFAARAEARPAQPHVLVIDEMNRGNLPRIFGELLYLLEYRGQAVELPCSRRAFRLPGNLYLLATMNAADRSIAVLDQALRRRFSFLEMEPDPAVLAAWLRAHPPAAGPAFVARVLGLFERLNSRLVADLGPHARVGHSYFMVPGLDEARLRMVWRHHVRPLLEDHFTGQPARAAAYDQLLETRPRAARGERTETVPQP